MGIREICFDTETTGLNPEQGDRVFEIGCVELIDKKPTGNTLRLLINPEKELSSASTEITGFTNADLEDKPIFKEVVDEFIEFIGDAHLVAHNANFDMKFINHELKGIGYSEIGMGRVIDTLNIAKKKYPGQKNSLDALCKRLEVDSSARTFHGALLDAELLADVYIRMIIGTGQISMFGGEQEEKDKKQEASKTVDLSSLSGEKLDSRNFNISEDILQKHKEFVEKSIKDSTWYSN